MITIKNLSFSYNKKKKSHRVFDKLNFTLKKGFNVIIGPNGAGKSTLIKAVFGLLDYKGEIYYGNESITCMDMENRIKLMSYLPQNDVDISSLTVLEMILLGRLPELGHKVSDDDLKIVNEILQSLNIQSLAGRNFSELSGGQKKLVFIAQTLVRKPKVILLDEPLNSLDLQKQLELCQLLKKIVKEQDVDIVLVLHDVNLAARYADHIVVMDCKGSVYKCGQPEHVITPQMLEQVYGVIADVGYDKKGIPVISPICSIRRI